MLWRGFWETAVQLRLRCPHVVIMNQARDRVGDLSGQVLCHLDSSFKKGMYRIRYMPGTEAMKLSPKKRQ